mgnify:CR=1 FL=1
MGQKVFHMKKRKNVSLEWLNEVNRQQFEFLLRKSEKENPELFKELMQGLRDHIVWLNGLLDRIKIKGVRLYE